MICPVCGGTEFVEEFGKQACIECGTINAKYVDVQVDAGAEALLNTKVARLRMIDVTNKVQRDREILKRDQERKCKYII